MPSRVAKQEIPLIFLQHETSREVFGRVKILAKDDVPDVAPNRTKNGEIPNELLREMILACCGA